jgi:hypothetical protein
LLLRFLVEAPGFSVATGKGAGSKHPTSSNLNRICADP